MCVAIGPSLCPAHLCVYVFQGSSDTTRPQLVPPGPNFTHLIASRSPTQLRLASPARTHERNETISRLDSPPQPPMAWYATEWHGMVG